MILFLQMARGKMENEIEDRFEKICSILEIQNTDLVRNHRIKGRTEFINPPEKLKNLMNYFLNRDIDESIGVFVMGSTGVGKTHFLLRALHSIAWKYFETNNGRLDFDVRYWSYSDLCAMIRSEPNDFNLFRQIRSPKFLFIDDLGTTKTTDIVNEKIYSLINYRIENELPTFITTNLSPAEIKEQFNERLLSRIKEGFQVFDLFDLPDYRNKIMTANVKKFKEK